MKVVLIIPVFITGGAETMVARLAVALKKQNVSVNVISMYPKQNTYLESIIENSGISVFYLGKEKHGSKKAIIKLYKLLNKLNPDVVHAHIYSTFYAIPWIILHRKVLIHTIHTKPSEEFSKRNSNILKLLVKLNKLVLVAVSLENLKLGMDYYNIDEKDMKYVNNPVNVSQYYHNEKQCKIVTFINVGRQDANKNQIMIIKAFNNVLKEESAINLILVGNGTHHNILEEEIKKLKLESHVKLLGERSDIPDILADSDVYVSASHREGLPLSILEGMAAKLPIISTNVGGCSDIVRDNGILIDDRDQQALEAAMIKLSRDIELRKQMGEKSRSMAMEYDAEACAKKYIAIYRDACKRGFKND